MTGAKGIWGLHHNAYRCRDSEETRTFYEDFLGLPMTRAMRLGETKTGRAVHALHTFFRMGDGSFLAFFEVPDSPFDFKPQHDFDLHIALAAAPETMTAMAEKARAAGRELRGPVDHGFIRSIYLRDPNGYVVELTAPIEHAAGAKSDAPTAHHILADWQRDKSTAVAR
jgi:catechol 2,3-dioxygenase-like lactoylglutathione lyase family enzyme